MAKSLEQRLYEALRRKVGCRLSPADIFDLVWMDNAVSMRICQAAAREAGGESLECGLIDSFGDATWEQMKQSVRNGEAE